MGGEGGGFLILNRRLDIGYAFLTIGKTKNVYVNLNSMYSLEHAIERMLVS